MKLKSMTSLAFAVSTAALTPISCGALALESAPHPHRPLLQAKTAVAHEGSDRTPVLSSSFASMSDTTDAFLTRRSAAISVLGCMFAVPGAALAASVGDEEPLDAAQKAAAAEAAKERMRQRIAESKTIYRKPTDLVKQRKDTTDYSCVSETGSPCPEGLVPRIVQREIVGVLDKLKE